MDQLAWIGGILGAVAAGYTAFRIPAIERLKARLERESTVYERQLDMIAELYERIATVEVAARTLMTPMRPAGMEPEEASRERFIAEFNQLQDFFSRRRLFIPKRVAGEVNDLISKLRMATEEFMLMRRDELSEEIRYGPPRKSPWRGWNELWVEVSKDIPEIREHIEDQFRDLLGTD